MTAVALSRGDHVRVEWGGDKMGKLNIMQLPSRGATMSDIPQCQHKTCTFQTEFSVSMSMTRQKFLGLDTLSGVV